MVNDISNAGFGSPSSSLPHDWTEGTGVLPASGQIIIASPSVNGQTRKWLFIQNQSAATISIIVAALKGNGAASTTTLLLAPGAGAGTMGGSLEWGGASWAVNSAVTVTGAAGAQVAIMEVTQ